MGCCSAATRDRLTSGHGQIAVCFTTNGSCTASRVLLALWIARPAAIPLAVRLPTCYYLPLVCLSTPALGALDTLNTLPLQPVQSEAARATIGEHTHPLDL